MSVPPRNSPDGAGHESADAPADDQESSTHDLLLEQLVTDVLAQMAAAAQEGRPLRADEWLARHDALAAHAESAVRIVYEEICLREERGESVDLAEIYRRFPQWTDALKVVLDCHRLIKAEEPVVAFPEAGQRLGELELLRELGRGALGRVFLATQPSLSDRPLVVKLTSQSGEEHLSLARLQHTNIVPLYLVLDFAQENLRALCMPYLGGASWSSILHAALDRPVLERSGQQIVELLEKANRDAAVAVHSSGPTIGFLARSGFEQAVCWIGSCLADALHYAHQRGLVHLDIKPSNVLLSGDGQPMLLDFHLAREFVEAGAAGIDRLGGTRGYLSPEQALAADAVRAGRPLPMRLDGRSDIYSLGVLLYESLCGHLPPVDEAEPRRRLRRSNPRVSRGLEDILHKCLAREPQARYADAEVLATDLRRHLAGLPLRGVPNRSLAERWDKLRRRKPHAVPLVAISLLALVVTGTVGFLFYSDRLREARSALAGARQDLETHEYSAAIERLEQGIQAVRWLPFASDAKQNLEAQLAVARLARLAGVLHDLVEKLRFVDSSPEAPAADLRAIDAGCRRIWQAREQIAAFAGKSPARPLDDGLRTDLMDLAMLWARLQVRTAPAGQLPAARRGAARILTEAQSLCGSNPILQLVGAEFADEAASGAVSDVAALRAIAQTPWEHDAVGRLLFEAGQFDEAQAEFEIAIRADPSAFWPNFYRVLCAYRRERFDEALAAADVCIALSPKSAECYFNRALCRQALHRDAPALDDFSRALELDPKLVPAALHRGMLLAEIGRDDEALVDMNNALRLGAKPSQVYHQMALVYLARGDHDAARTCLRKALEDDANFAPAQALERRMETEP